MGKKNKKFETSLPNSPSDNLGTSPLTEQSVSLFPEQEKQIQKTKYLSTVADTNLTKHQNQMRLKGTFSK